VDATAPAGFVWGLFVVTAIGALLPVRTERREDFPIMAIAVTVAASLLGPWCLPMLWAAVAVTAPVWVAWNVVPRHRSRLGWTGAGRSLVWLLVTAVACTVGFVVGGGVYVGLFGRSYPATLDSLAAVGAALGSVTAAFVGTMTVVALAVRRVSGPLIARGLDPFDSMSVPYVMPVMGGFPLVVASVAMYDPASPWPSLVVLVWCFPLYAATAIDLHRRRLAQELRRDVMAKQRLAAIGEVSARLVHQTRHQVGLMGWSIHRLRGLLEPASRRPIDADAVRLELDELTAAKDRLSVMLASDVLHEPSRASSGPVPVESATPTLGEVVGDVRDQLEVEAAREGVRLVVDDGAGPDAATRPVPAALVDVVFNLVDNAIDAAGAEVVLRIVAGPAATVVRVEDDGSGLVDGDVSRALEPFFTTKADGTGMGLAIADALVGDLGGVLRYERRGDRTAFVVELPSPVASRPAQRLPTGGGSPQRVGAAPGSVADSGP
jgi:signal transduction histidine kinase